MNWLKNWATTTFGTIAGVPQIAAGLMSKPIDWRLVITGVATLALGVVAKDANKK